MSGKASAVLWIGLIIIALNLMSQWSEIKKVLFSGSSGGSGGTSSPGINIPIDPFLPGIGNIRIPLAAGQPASTGTSGVQAV
jgi:hypothetical protein